jgi:hypothetical protein
MAEEYTESLGKGEDELAVREIEQELLVEVFGKQKSSLLRTGRTEVESFARKRSEILEAAFGIGTLDPGDTLGVVAAAFEFVHHAGDTVQTELAVVMGIEGVVGIGESMEMVVEDELERIGCTRGIGRAECGWGRDGR